MRDAESALDQLISFCGEKIVESDVLSMFGLAAQGQIIALADAILGGDAQTVLRELERRWRSTAKILRACSPICSATSATCSFTRSAGEQVSSKLGEAEAAAIQRAICRSSMSMRSRASWKC